MTANRYQPRNYEAHNWIVYDTQTRTIYRNALDGTDYEPYAERVDAEDAANRLNRTVACDQDCGALDAPVTFDEFKAALVHWRDHGLYGGCSHGGT